SSPCLWSRRVSPRKRASPSQWTSSVTSAPVAVSSSTAGSSGAATTACSPEGENATESPSVSGIRYFHSSSPVSPRSPTRPSSSSITAPELPACTSEAVSPSFGRHSQATSFTEETASNAWTASETSWITPASEEGVASRVGEQADAAIHIHSAAVSRCLLFIALYFSVACPSCDGVLFQERVRYAYPGLLGSSNFMGVKR